MPKKKNSRPVIGPGRPSKFDQATAERVCDRIARGSSARAACLAEKVDDRTFLGWVAADRGGLFAHYARAREAGNRRLADELIEIADDASMDPQRSKLMVDTRKWVLSKQLPKDYGDRVEVTGASTVSHAVVVIPAESTLEEWTSAHGKKPDG